jgi:hypothetical protein
MMLKITESYGKQLTPICSPVKHHLMENNGKVIKLDAESSINALAYHVVGSVLLVSSAVRLAIIADEKYCDIRRLASRQ